ELTDLYGSQLDLLTLQADKRLLLFLVKKPDSGNAAYDQCNADDDDKQGDVFSKQPAPIQQPGGLPQYGPGLHSMTSSANASTVRHWRLRPSAMAVLRLMTNWNLVGSSTGRSAGLSPLRTRPV